MNNPARRLSEPLAEPDAPVLKALSPGPKTNPAALTPRQHAASVKVPANFKRNAMDALSSTLGGGEEAHEL